MNTKNFINIILLLILIHFMLESMDYKFEFNFGKYIENFNQNYIENFNQNYNNTNKINNDIVIEEEENPKPSNLNKNKHSDSKFKSEKSPLSKFYIKPIEKYNNDIPKQGNLNKYSQIDSEWKYKEELPMNGGLFGNLTGFDTSSSDHALYMGK